MLTGTISCIDGFLLGGSEQVLTCDAARGGLGHFRPELFFRR
jgi:hypothetical protein